MKKFKELREHSLEEKLKASDPAGTYVSDFVHSDNPKFAGKSKAKRIQMALAASYAAKGKSKNEEVEELDELSKSTLGSYVNKARSQVRASAGANPNNSHIGTDPKIANRARGAVKANNRLNGFGPVQKEEVESLDEGKMDKMTLSGLWHKHAQHSYWNDQGYGSGTDSPRHSGHAATSIENHVRKHHGNKVADDMVSHSDHHVAYHEYAGPEESPHHEKEMAKLKKKHGISDKQMHESAPPGFEGTVRAMSHQAATTMKHIPNPSPALKKAAKDIKPGIAGYRDRIDMLKAGGVKEEAEQVEEGIMNAVKNLAAKAGKALTGGSDEDQRKDLQRKMGVPQTGKKPTQK